MQGDHSEAIRHLQEARRPAGNSLYLLGALGHIYAQTGLHEHAREILHLLVERSRTQFISSALMAQACAGLLDYETALAWLGRAVQERTAAAFTFDVDPDSTSFDRCPDFARR